MRRTALILGALIGGPALGGFTACGNDVADSATPTTESQVPFPSDGGLARWPHETLTDWVSYGDVAVVATVIDAAEIAPSTEIAKHGGLVGRTITVRRDQVVWQHPAAPDPPETFEFVDYGWIIHDGARTPFTDRGTVRLEVGEQYLLLVAQLSDEGWFPVHPSTVLGLTSDRTDIAPEGAVPAARAVGGLSVDAIGSALSTAPPDPVAEANRHLDIQSRWWTVRDDDAPTASSQPPTTD